MAAYHAIIYDSSLLLNQILAYASSGATLSEKQAEIIQSSGLGLITKWSPQQFILNHPVSHLIYYFVRTQYLEFHRSLDSSLHMEVFVALLNLLRAVSHCKNVLQFPTHLGVFLFIEFSGRS